MQTFAELNHGRWIIPCPNCRSAELADRQSNGATWGSPFSCVNCGVGPVDVVYPSDGFRAEIESAAAVRPLEYRNWRPGDRVVDMLEDNARYLPAVAAGLTVIADPTPPPVLLVVRRPTDPRLAAMQDALGGEYTLRHNDADETIEVEVTDDRTLDTLHEIVKPHAKRID